MIRDIFLFGLLFIHSFHCFEYSTSEIRSSDRNLHRNIEGYLTWEKIKSKTKNALIYSHFTGNNILYERVKRIFFLLKFRLPADHIYSYWSFSTWRMFTIILLVYYCCEKIVWFEIIFALVLSIQKDTESETIRKN